jgi:hypothetical protein
VDEIEKSRALILLWSGGYVFSFQDLYWECLGVSDEAVVRRVGGIT